MTLIEMHNPKNAVYLENLIAVKDLVSFVAEDVDDMNKFVNLTRDHLKVRINCVHGDPNTSLDRFKPLVKPEEFKNMDFQGKKELETSRKI